jgi:dTDP-glucose 4,6-dehydratase
VLDLAERIRDLAGSPSPTEFVERPVDDPGKRRPDCSLAERVLGWRPRVPCETGLARTIKWFGECLAAA